MADKKRDEVFNRKVDELLEEIVSTDWSNRPKATTPDELIKKPRTLSLTNKYYVEAKQILGEDGSNVSDYVDKCLYHLIKSRDKKKLPNAS